MGCQIHHVSLTKKEGDKSQHIMGIIMVLNLSFFFRNFKFVAQLKFIPSKSKSNTVYNMN